MEGQTLGLALITGSVSGFAGILLWALQNNRAGTKLLTCSALASLTVLSVGTLYLLGKLG
ncbi:hypothetical protein DYH09_23730 [bacterium CPR1]|nr:hypothetical protein [bacterium CPR1]